MSVPWWCRYDGVEVSPGVNDKIPWLMITFETPCVVAAPLRMTAKILQSEDRGQNTLLVNFLSSGTEPLEGRDPRWSRKVAIQPGSETNNIDSSSNTHMLQMGLVKANVT